MSENAQEIQTTQTTGVPMAPEPTPAQRGEMVQAKYDVATIETVKRVVFPKATDDELRIYLYRCLIAGVHPLDGRLIPVKYRGKDGEPDKLAFTSTIDYFRSKAQDSGDYDGQDEAELVGESSFNYEGENVTHPDEAIVRVYRKSVSRPFVGRAKWSEFYPGHRRGQMWRKMPATMLTKCAEAQAIRKGFPERLGQIYAIEEMEQAAEEQGAERAASGKPRTTAPKLKYGPTTESNQQPTDEDRKAAGQLTDAQIRRLMAIASKAGVSEDDLKVGVKAKWNHDHLWQLAWKGKGSQYELLCTQLEKAPKKFLAYVAESRAGQVEMPTDSFPAELVAAAKQCGIYEEQLPAVLEAEFSFTDEYVDMPEETRTAVMAWLNQRSAQGETAGA